MKSCNPSFQILTLMTLLFTLFDSSAVSADAGRTKFRKHEDGPLRIEEFKGKPDGTLGGDAYTACSVEFRFKYLVEPNGTKFDAKVSSIETFSVFLPKKSWWKRRAQPALLDHEQGHFDIAEATARRLQLAFDKQLRQNSIIRGTGESTDAAVNALRLKLSKVIKRANEQMTQANLDYDATTLHGMRFHRQTELRRVQKASLLRLAKEIEANSVTRRVSRAP